MEVGKYKATIEVLNEPTVILKSDGEILAANSAALRLFGVLPVSLIGRSLYQSLITPATGLSTYLRSCARSRQPLTGAMTIRVGEDEIELVARGGVLEPKTHEADALVLVRLFPKFEINKRFTDLKDRIDHLNEEIHKRKRAEYVLQMQAEKLQEASRKKNEFLVMLAHELRNPLTPIQNTVEIFKVHSKNPDIIEKAAEILDRQVHHLNRIVEDLLDVSRIIRGRSVIKKERIDLSKLIVDICNDNKPQFQGAGLRLDINVPGSPIWLEVDPTRVNQILDNLLSNANKFTPAGGRVEVTLSASEGYAVITVSDTGVGIEKALLSKLFEPFVQAEQDIARSNGGLGLGLNIIKGLVDMHDGKIMAESLGKDKGARFTVILPLTATSGSLQAQSKSADIDRRKVLVIEDNIDTAETLRILLVLSGHQVFLAKTGNEGVQKAMQIMPDIILCDIGLPEMDGFAVAEYLRKNPDTATIWLISITAYSDSSMEERAYRAGFDKHLIKPVKAEDIQRAIRSAP